MNTINHREPGEFGEGATIVWSKSPQANIYAGDVIARRWPFLAQRVLQGGVTTDPTDARAQAHVEGRSVSQLNHS